MSRFAFLFLFLITLGLTVGSASARPFWLDAEGRVFTIDSFGRIAIDGASTNWYPTRSPLDLIVTSSGDAVYTDSYGRLCRNGSNLGYSWIRPHTFKVDGDGNIYTVHDWVSDRIQRNGQDTPFEITKGSGFVVDREGHLYYTSARTGTLCIDGADTGKRFDRDDFKVGPDGSLFYVNFMPNNGNQHWLNRFDPTTGAHHFVAWLAQHDAYDFDIRGNLWTAEVGWAIKKNGTATGWRGPSIHLDGAGGVYTRSSDGRILRSGEDTGFVARGVFEVAASGAVVYVADPGNGILFRDGVSLGIQIGSDLAILAAAP